MYCKWFAMAFVGVSLRRSAQCFDYGPILMLMNEQLGWTRDECARVWRRPYGLSTRALVECDTELAGFYIVWREERPCRTTTEGYLNSACFYFKWWGDYWFILLIISKDLIRYATCSIPRELCTYTSVHLSLKLVCLTMDETLTSNDLHVYYCWFPLMVEFASTMSLIGSTPWASTSGGDLRGSINVNGNGED